MSKETLKEQLDSFVKFIIEKVDKNEYDDIQKRYNELIEFYDKFSIFSDKDFETYEKIMNEAFQQEIKRYKAQRLVDSDKIQSLKKELSNNLEINEKYIQLNEEYNKINEKFNVYKVENSEFQIKIKKYQKLINDLQSEMNKIKKENFEKYEKITELDKKNKMNEIKLNQANDKINKITIENNNLTKANTELKNNYLDQQKTYQGKILVLERQIKHLTDANNNFVQENNEVQTQLKDFQMYTNMAKVNTKKLNKEDFSILETMSRRAEYAELEVQKLLSYIDELKNLNEKLRNKIKPLEDYAILQIKHDHEINTGIDIIYDLKNKVFTDEERNEIEKLKNEPNELLQSLIKLKTENLELHNQLKDITIECNQQLREAKRKIKTY